MAVLRSLVYLLIAVPLAGQGFYFSAAMAQGQAPEANVRDIVRQSLQFEMLFELFDFTPPPDYICEVEQERHRIDANGQPRDATSETHEVMRLYDATFERLIRKNGQELPPDKARVEQGRFDKAVEKRAHETPEAQAKRHKAEQKFQAERNVCRDEFMNF